MKSRGPTPQMITSGCLVSLQQELCNQEAIGRHLARQGKVESSESLAGPLFQQSLKIAAAIVPGGIDIVIEHIRVGAAERFEHERRADEHDVRFWSFPGQVVLNRATSPGVISQVSRFE